MERKLSEQRITKVENDSKMKRGKKYEGSTEHMISTGSTLLDLAIAGGRVKGGGIPGGILVEIFGPSGTGKTVLLCEIAGGVKRAGGEVMFKDPEARLNNQFAKIFDLDVDEIAYDRPNTVPEVFKPIRSWEPEDTTLINGIFADSLAALSTDMELGETGDKMGMRRAKEFSEELRKTARILTQKNFLMVASNQIRDNVDGGAFGQKHVTPGGHGVEFYASLRLRMVGNRKIKKEVTYKGKKVIRVIGVESDIEVYKSSVWKPHRQATVTIIFDYGMDDIRQNLQYVKKYTGAKVYELNGTKLSNSIDKAIEMIEEDQLEQELQDQVISIWEDIESQFDAPRKPKRR